MKEGLSISLRRTYIDSEEAWNFYVKARNLAVNSSQLYFPPFSSIYRHMEINFNPLSPFFSCACHLNRHSKKHSESDVISS